MARIWRGIGYVDCGPVPIRFHRWFTLCSIQLYYRTSTGLLYVTASGTCVCTQVSTCHLLLQQPPASAPRPATRRASATKQQPAASATPLLPASTQPAAWAPRPASAAQRPWAPPLPGRRVGAVIASTSRRRPDLNRAGRHCRQRASPGGSCTSGMCQYRISFVTLALREKLCNDSYDSSLTRSDNVA